MALLFILCAAGMIAAMPVFVQAATATRTLQPGVVYTFTGQNRRVISHINVAGTSRYQYVAIDDRGDVVSYGFSFGRASVSGEGATQITPLSAMTVTFDTTRLVMTETPGDALRQISLNNRQTLSLQSHGRVNQHIRTNQNAPYDLVVTNATGGTAFLNRDVRFPQFNVPVGGEAVVTALGNGLVVYFPAFWYGGTVQARRLSHPAIFSYTVRVGETYVLNLSGERSATLEAEPLFTTAAFSYDFITRDRQGFAVNHGEATGNRVTLQPHRPMTLTPHMDAELFMPYAQTQNLNISQGTSTPAYRALEAGQTLQITNADPVRAYNVYLASEPGGYPIVYDFTLETEDELTFVIRGSAGTVRIPPGGVLTLTAGNPPDWAPQDLAVRFSDSEAITVTAAASTLTQYTLGAGESFLLTNNGDDAMALTLLALTENTSPDKLDFVLTNPEGETADFGQRAATGSLTIEPGYRIHLTNPPENTCISFFFPLAWQAGGLSLQEADAPALFRRVLEPGEYLRFDNINTRYNRPLLVENANDTRGAEFDFVLTNNSNAILSYGTQGMGMFTMRHASRLTIMPANDATLHVSYPAQWHTRIFRIAAATAPPLHHIILQPGQRLILHNNASTETILSNNSAPDGAGYFTRTGNNVHNEFIPRETPAAHGTIRLLPGTNTLIVAAPGEDLHIWMPVARARQLRLI
jgi:hypothetical protein